MEDRKIKRTKGLPLEADLARLDVPGLVAIPLGKLRESLNELDRGKETITLCKIGLRSYEAYRILKGAGFKNVRFMDGGLDMWTYEGDDLKAK